MKKRLGNDPAAAEPYNINDIGLATNQKGQYFTRRPIKELSEHDTNCKPPVMG
jgi:hypothetical protein